MSARVVINREMQQFYDALRRLPTELTDEARGIVNVHANRAAQDIRQAYPLWNGPPSYIGGRKVTPEHLKDGIEVVGGEHVAYTARAFVLQNSALGYIYESGAAQARENKNFANRGSTEPGNVFIPRVVKYRAQMVEALKRMMARHGLLVRGDVDTYA